MKKRKQSKEIFDHAGFEQEAISKLRSGKGLTGEGGALTGLISRIVTAAFEGEIPEHPAGARLKRVTKTIYSLYITASKSTVTSSNESSSE